MRGGLTLLFLLCNLFKQLLRNSLQYQSFNSRYNNYKTDKVQDDLFIDNYVHIYREPVSTGKRFANYVIDIVVFYIIIFCMALFFGLLNFMPNGPVLYLMVYAVFVGYYTFLEGATHGQTIGKIITGCRAVKDDGSSFTWKDAFLRSISRIVPFEPLSGLNGHPWHDSWTNTKVVKNIKNSF